MQEEQLDLALQLIRSGRIDESRRILESFLKENRSHVLAWKLYAETWPDAANRMRVWEYCLRFNPGNQLAVQAMAELKGVRPAGAPPAPSAQGNQGVPAVPRRSGAFHWLLFGGIGVLALAVLAGMVALVNSYPKDPAGYRHETPVEYYLYVPHDYSADREWPLFVGIHGAGSSGLECWNMWQVYAEREDFILLCPTIPGDAGGYWQDVGEETVWSAVGEVHKGYRVNQRMFLAGFSAGAFFIQGFAYHHPNAVRVLAILSSAIYMPNVPQVPILVVIGDADDPAAVRASEQMTSDLTQYGYDIQRELLPGVGHTVTRTAKTMTIELFRKTLEE